MHYLIISSGGCGFYFAPRLGKASDTKKVYFYCADTRMSKLGKNMELFDGQEGWNKFERVKEPHAILNAIPKNDLIVIFDDNGFGHFADSLRKQGYSVVGGGSIADELESDRWGAIMYMRTIMDVPESEYHEVFDSGIASLKKKPKDERWVFKPQDNAAPKDKTYVSKNIPDLINAMQEFKQHWEWDEGFVLQKFVEGLEADFNCYFDGKDWIPNTLGWYFENKPFLPGDIGSSGGGELAVTFYQKNEGSIWHIFEEMKPMLTKYNYHGQIAINTVFSEEDHKPYFLELTPRFGFPGSDVEITLIEEGGKSFTDLIKQIAFGGKETKLYPQNMIAVEVTVSTPPYPSDEASEKLTSDLPFSWDKKWSNYMFPWHCYYDDKKKTLKLTGNSGHALHVTCVGETLSSAVEMLYDEYIPSIQLQSKQYRNDLGESAKKRIKKLKEWKVL